MNREGILNVITTVGRMAQQQLWPFAGGDQRELFPNDFTGDPFGKVPADIIIRSLEAKKDAGQLSDAEVERVREILT